SRSCGVVTSAVLVDWVARGGGDVSQPGGTLLRSPVTAAAVGASVTEGILQMGASGLDALPLTADGTVDGGLHGVITARDLFPVFGDQPLALLRDIHIASSPDRIRELNTRVRAFTLQYLTGPGSVDWLTRFTQLADMSILRRLIAIEGADTDGCCWCV